MLAARAAFGSADVPLVNSSTAGRSGASGNARSLGSLLSSQFGRGDDRGLDAGEELVERGSGRR